MLRVLSDSFCSSVRWTWELRSRQVTVFLIRYNSATCHKISSRMLLMIGRHAPSTLREPIYAAKATWKCHYQ
jgi:hypothetical protein